jgi:hypothetical protein
MSKSQERVKATGEVFTPPWLVNDMLDKLPWWVWTNTAKTYLDPACGNGNFLVEVLRRKIANGATPTQALSTTYGIDIMMDNVMECRKRLFEIVHGANGNAIEQEWKDILTTNIAVGDALRFDTDDIFGITPTSEELKEFRWQREIAYKVLLLRQNKTPLVPTVLGSIAARYVKRLNDEKKKEAEEKPEKVA